MLQWKKLHKILKLCNSFSLYNTLYRDIHTTIEHRIVYCVGCVSFSLYDAQYHFFPLVCIYIYIWQISKSIYLFRISHSRKLWYGILAKNNLRLLLSHSLSRSSSRSIYLPFGVVVLSSIPLFTSHFSHSGLLWINLIVIIVLWCKIYLHCIESTINGCVVFPCSSVFNGIQFVFVLSSFFLLVYNFSLILSFFPNRFLCVCINAYLLSFCLLFCMIKKKYSTIRRKKNGMNRFE